MELTKLSRKESYKAFGIGIATSLILSAISVPMFLAGISPMPKPPSLAFAETILGPGLPMPVRDRLSFGRALALVLFLWIVALVVFFPIVGWGFFGLAIGPKLIVGALVPHLLFAIVLWGLCRLAFDT